MKYYIKNRKSNFDANKGFTLIELLVAALLMSIVVALAGTAFVGILRQNRKAEFESERRTNLNRALDYIANEIRMANKIESTSGLTLPTGAVGVLKLTIPIRDPDPSLTDFNYYVVYYTYNTASGWESPKSIGRYSNVDIPVPVNPTPSPAAIATVPAPGNSNLLVDGIKTPSSAPTCPTGSTLASSDGFYACIYTGGRKADIFLYGKLSNSTNETMLVRSTVFTRSN